MNHNQSLEGVVGVISICISIECIQVLTKYIGTKSKLSDILDATYSDLLSITKSTTEIILVRHGQTEWNVIHRLQGHQDSNLTLNGMNGAIEAGKKLYKLHKYDRKISYIYSSPLGRAKNTTKLILKQFTDCNIDIEYDDSLKERNLGDLQGRTLSELRKNEPKTYNLLESDIKWKPSGKHSESKLDVYNRSIKFLAKIASKHHGKRILVVCHGGVIQLILSDILAHTVQAKTFPVKNCSINIIQREPNNGKWYCSVLGDDNYGNLKQLSSDYNNSNSNQFSYIIASFAIVCAVGYIIFNRR